MALLRPSTLLLIAINMVPLIGVYAWGWDGFVLLMLYWLETASIAFWTVARILATPRDTAQRPPPLLMAAFISVHVGIFMAVHMIFLWILFSGSWSEKIHGIRDFINQMVIGTGLWLPLLALFIGRGLMMLFDTVRPALLQHMGIKQPAGIKAPIVPDTAFNPESGIIGALYTRIVVMQVTIILGAWAMVLSGGRGTLVLVVAVKTIADLVITLRAERDRSDPKMQNAADVS